MSEGAWIFLSHSHKDFDRIVPLRNNLEKDGHHPLMFFLKCLDDDAEIDALIEREIEARSWFILCDSPNAKGSRWVREEIKIIKKLPDKTWITVDLGSSLDKQLRGIKDLTQRASVFLSYQRQDSAIAARIASELRADDFGVFLDLDRIQPGTNWQAAIEDALTDAIEHGAVVALLSVQTLASKWVIRELEFAIQLAADRRGSVVPVFLEPPYSIFENCPAELRRRLERIAGVELWEDFDAGMRELKQGLRNLSFRVNA